MSWDWGTFTFGRSWRVLLFAAGAGLLFGSLSFGFVSPAQALPSFARQTGQPCGACHTDFAGLTPYGRRFEIGGYTYGGGAYRTTLFPSSDDPVKRQKEMGAADLDDGAHRVHAFSG